jgi:hypothetical protein
MHPIRKLISTTSQLGSKLKLKFTDTFILTNKITVEIIRRFFTVLSKMESVI